LNNDALPEDVFGISRSNRQLEIMILVNLGATLETIILPSIPLVPKVHLQVGQPSTITNASAGLSLELPARSGVVFESSDHRSGL
jgi:hypothetical protein